MGKGRLRRSPGPPPEDRTRMHRSRQGDGHFDDPPPPPPRNQDSNRPHHSAHPPLELLGSHRVGALPPGSNSGGRIRPGDFSFRAPAPSDLSFMQQPPSGPRAQRSLRQPPDSFYPPPNRRPFGYQKPRTSERALLSGQRQSTPEQLENMGGTSSKYAEASTPSESKSDLATANEPVTQADEQRPAKRQDTKPKWSNPDPYSVLPPVDSSAGKRPDFVKFIRTSRESGPGQIGSKEEGNDFISFGGVGDAQYSEEGQASSDSYDAPSEQGSRLASTQFQAPLMSQDTSLPLKPPISARQIRGMANPQLSNVNGPQQAFQGPQGSIPAGPMHMQPPGTTGYNRGIPMDQWPPPPPPPAAAMSASQQTVAQQQSPRGKKRAHTDVSERDPYKAPPGGNRPDPYVLPKWFKFKDMPWLDHNLRLATIHDKMQQLHVEVASFFNYLEPTAGENEARRSVVRRVQKMLDSYFPTSEAEPFGSFAAGLYLPTADMDIVIMTQDYKIEGFKVFGKGKDYVNYNQVVKALRYRDRCDVAQPGSVIPILQARVPIIKYIDKLTRLHVDISFENNSGIVTNRRYRAWCEQYPGMKPLIALIKLYLNMRDFDDPAQGGIGGFTVTCLVVMLLEKMQREFRGGVNPVEHLGFALYTFFDFYGDPEKFNMTTTEINMKYMTLEPKSSPGKALVVKDPDNTDNNIAHASKNASLIFMAFNDAFIRLDNRIKAVASIEGSDQKVNILGVLYAGNYREFDNVRRTLRNLAQ